MTLQRPNVQQRSYGAEIVSYDRYTESREDVAAGIRDERALTLIPLDHLEVIAGQSTCVQELFNQSGLWINSLSPLEAVA